MSNERFNTLPYSRPDLGAYEASIHDLSARMDNAKDASTLKDLIEDWNSLRKHYMTMHSLADVHYSQNVADKDKKAEKHFFDEVSPTVRELNAIVERKLVDSPFRKTLEQHYGALFFRLLEEDLRVFVPEIKPFMIEESELCNEYNEITASARIELDEKVYNLSTIGKMAVDLDRDLRKRATEALYSFLEDNAEKIDSIYDRLVQLRTEKARMLGFPSYTEFRYVEFGRIDYNQHDVEVFRQQVIDHIVPIAAKLRAAQARRLGLDVLKVYDEKLQFPDGNPIATGEHDFIVDAARTMYNELSPETKEFFTLMLDRELMDLKARDNKATGGYCTSFADHGVPFIFANFNQTTHDVEVLTHEAGHAFQSYRSRNVVVPEYLWPTSEACEIHSMGMEFLTWPWMKLFFGEQTDKFRFYHLAGAILFLPYGCAVDHFQHWIYAHPEATPQERNQQWLELERLYLPWRDSTGIPAAEAGRQWQFQRHIFESPFYYIDYALAQTCALQYWKASEEDRDKAFADYLKICDVGGSQSFLQIVETGNLESPFQPGVLDDIVDYAESWLEKSFPDYV